MPNRLPKLLPTRLPYSAYQHGCLDSGSWLTMFHFPPPLHCAALPLFDLSATDEWSLGWLLSNCRTLVLPDIKTAFITAILNNTASCDVNQVPHVGIDRLAAADSVHRTWVHLLCYFLRYWPQWKSSIIVLFLLVVEAVDCRVLKSSLKPPENVDFSMLLLIFVM